MKKERALVVITCQHCGRSEWSKQRNRKFCSDSCRTLHSRSKRLAAIPALAALHGIPADKSADLLDTFGTKRVTAILEAAGLVYDSSTRSWIKQTIFNGGK